MRIGEDVAVKRGFDVYKIAQLTDVHIGGEGEDTFGVDVRNNFTHAIARVIRDGVDEVLLTGDLAYRSGRPEIYAWLAEQLEALPVRWTALPGNHDDAAMMKVAFGSNLCAQQAAERTIGKRKVIFLDSGPSRLETSQLRALEASLVGQTIAPLIFVHHPPFALGVPYMDEEHMLENHPAFVDALRVSDVGVHVFCGHYHVERTVVRGTVTVHATPSTFFQIDARHEAFMVDHQVPGYRLVAFDDEQIQTTVCWLLP